VDRIPFNYANLIRGEWEKNLNPLRHPLEVDGVDLNTTRCNDDARNDTEQ
jgi:hypothetical protein